MTVGARIRQYRTARGYTLEQLVERMDGVVTKQALSKYEHDRAMPRPTVLVALARALGTKASRLMGEPAYRLESPGYRALASMPVRERESIENVVRLELERRLALADRLGLGHEYPFEGIEVEVHDVADAEHAAEEVREAWGLGTGPVSSVVDALETRGVHLIDVSTERAFDGLAVVAYDEEGQRVACGAATRQEVTRARQRLNHAHEAGHFATFADDDRLGERAARRFGAAFLFPARAVREEFGSSRTRITTEELLIAKQRWGLSVQAVLYRLHDLGILGDSDYSWWCMRINKSGWRALEPGDEPPERSTWKQAYAHRAVAEGLIAEETLAEYLPRDTRTRERYPGDIDRGALMKLPLEERRAIIRAHAESIADEYNQEIDHEWLDADLGEWDHEGE